MRSQAGQRHYMKLVSIAYLVVNDLKACIQAIEKSKEKFDVLIVFKKALSVMISTKLRFGSQVFQLAE